MKFGFCLLASLSLVLIGASCDRHTWDDDPVTGAKGTKRLFAVHHGGDHDNHGDDTHHTGEHGPGEVERNAHGTSDPHNAENFKDEAGH